MNRIHRTTAAAISLLAGLLGCCVSPVAAQVESGVSSRVNNDKSNVTANEMPQSEDKHFSLGMSAFLDDRYEIAVKETTTAIALGGNGLVYLWRGHAYVCLGENEKAIEVYGHAIHDLQFRIRSLIPRYGANFDDGKTQRSIAVCYASRAIAYDRLKRYDSAVADLSEALAIDSFFQWLELRSKIYEKTGKLDLARQDLKQAQELKQQAKPAQF